MAKANKRQALGRGLSALLDNSENFTTSNEYAAGNVVMLALDQIEVNPYQPRTNFNEEAIESLAKSIQALGLIQPITVRKTDSEKFQLVSGERRLRAAKIIGLSSIPSFIRTADDQEILEMALVENIQREDLDPIEVALSYQRLIDDIELTQEELSERVGKNSAHGGVDGNSQRCDVARRSCQSESRIVEGRDSEEESLEHVEIPAFYRAGDCFRLQNHRA